MTDQHPCEICGMTAETIPSNGEYRHQKCPRCGEFKISSTAESLLESRHAPEFIAKLSGWVYDQNRGGDFPMISSTVLDEVDGSKALSVTQRSQRLLLEAVRGQSKLGEDFNINEPRFISATHSQDKREVGVLLKVLADQDLMKTVALGGATEILPRGYTEAEELRIDAPGLDVEATSIDVSDAQPQAGTSLTTSAEFEDKTAGGGGFSIEFSDEFAKDQSSKTGQSETRGESFSDGTYFDDNTGFDKGTTKFDATDDSTEQNMGRPGVLSDTIYDNEDKLQFTSRAKTFAKLIADESLQLPLAIGLFGNWGTGKSFFMNLVREGVDEVTKDAREPFSEHSTHLPRIAQIDFNAWHYTDANLWASMATRIYQGLIEELAGPEISTDAKARAELWTDIQSSKRQIEAAEADRATAKDQREKAFATLKNMKLEKEDAENKLGLALIKNLKNANDRNRMINQLGDIAGKLGFPGAIESTRDVNSLITEFESIAGSTRAIWCRLRQYFMTTRGALAFTVIFAMALFAIFNLSELYIWISKDLFHEPNFLTWVSDRVSALVAESIISVSAAAAWIGVQLKRASDGLAKARDLRAGINNLMKPPTETVDPLTEEKKKLRVAEAAVDARELEIKETEHRLEEADKELQRINSGGLVYDFLAEKLGASEYTKSLGLISTIREDLQNLGQLMEGWREKGPKNNENTYPIKRIVLYIDDLDRCHPDRVVEVLQALHLLLAFELFVVVVAVDARWLERSLYLEYAPELFDGKGVPEILTKVEGFNPQNYLEKIFQIPFLVPDMAQEGFEELMNHLAGEITIPDSVSSQSTESKAKIDAVNSPSPSPISQHEITGYERDDELTNEATTEGERVNGSAPEKKAHDELPARTPLASRHATPVPALLTEEAKCLRCMHSLIKTPRSAKRLVNLYRLIRIHSLENTSGLTIFMDKDEKPYVVAALMLAISIAYPDVSRSLIASIRNKSRAEGFYPSSSMDEPRFDQFSREMSWYMAHFDDEEYKSGGEYIEPMVKVVKAETLKKFGADLNKTIGSLTRAGLDPDKIHIQTFRNWASEIECYSFTWNSKSF